MDAANTPTVDAWLTEPPAGPESLWSPSAGPEWTAWNEWSVEREVADFMPTLIDLIDPKFIVETGCGQGFITRRIATRRRRNNGGPRVFAVYEADPDWRTAISQLDWWSEHPTVVFMDHAMPDIDTISQADLLILDSHWPQRFPELAAWMQHGKTGSFVFVHDVNPNANPQSGHGLLYSTIYQSGIPHMLFDNPRGSALLYRPEGWVPKDRAQPNTRDVSMLTRSGGVFVAQIDGGTTEGAFTHSMARTMAYTMQWPGLLAGYIRRLGGPRVYAARTEVVKHFLAESKADWLLQIDSDMVFNWTIIADLVAQADPVNRPIVAAHCYMLRGESGPLPTMWTSDRPGGRLQHFEQYERGGLVEVEATGGACILIHRRVFEAMAAIDPAYPFPWYEETYWDKEPVGEDLTFCVRARRLGFPIFVDTSLDVGHQKTVTVNHEFYDDWRRLRRFVVTGTGRCGTGYVAQLLQNLRVSCGHERVYHPTTTEPDWRSRWGEASWMAAPFLERFDGPIIQVVRNPLAVVNSFVGMGMFDEGDDNPHRGYRDFALGHRRHQFWGSPTEQAMFHVAEWFEWCHQYAGLTIRLEDIHPDNPDPVIDLLEASRTPGKWSREQVAETIGATATNINTRDRGDLTWKALRRINRGLTDRLVAQADMFGYDTPA